MLSSDGGPSEQLTLERYMPPLSALAIFFRLGFAPFNSSPWFSRPIKLSRDDDDRVSWTAPLVVCATLWAWCGGISGEEHPLTLIAPPPVFLASREHISRTGAGIMGPACWAVPNTVPTRPAQFVALVTPLPPRLPRGRGIIVGQDIVGTAGVIMVTPGLTWPQASPSPT
jgi:hypothetical protein